MENSIQVENIKCGGCANFIQKELSKIQGISNIKVDIDNGVINFESGDDFEDKTIINKLSKMGYPALGDGNLVSTAKSFVSCMIGRTTNQS